MLHKGFTHLRHLQDCNSCSTICESFLSIVTNYALLKGFAESYLMAVAPSSKHTFDC